jgi:hypothetical protein
MGAMIFAVLLCVELALTVAILAVLSERGAP